MVMKTIDNYHQQKPIGIPTVLLQMALSAIAFVTMALVMSVWTIGKLLISYVGNPRTIQRNFVAPVLVVQRGGDMLTNELRGNRKRKAYYCLLRHLLTEEVQSSFKEQHERPPTRISELIRQLDQITHAFAR